MQKREEKRGKKLKKKSHNSIERADDPEKNKKKCHLKPDREEKERGRKIEHFK